MGLDYFLSLVFNFFSKLLPLKFSRLATYNTCIQILQSNNISIILSNVNSWLLLVDVVRNYRFYVFFDSVFMCLQYLVGWWMFLLHFLVLPIFLYLQKIVGRWGYLLSVRKYSDIFLLVTQIHEKTVLIVLYFIFIMKFYKLIHS